MNRDFSRYFGPGRVHRRIYTDPKIFEQEMTLIFGRAWVYIGHESQIKNPGDYFATQMGRRPPIAVQW
jgi:phenylpropionate dioxygenase-like ring-hydroxylating dioxygenase large terminal subunit